MTTFADTPIAMASDSEAALRRQARKRVDQKMGFLVHLLVYVCVNAGLFGLAYVFGNGRWTSLPLLGWGLGLAIHGLVTLLSLQGQGLRERLMQAELQTLRQRAAR